MAIFIHNFERTKNSDEIFGVIGRALVIATRFDSMCKNLSRSVDLKLPSLLRGISDNEFESLVERTLKKSSTLDKSINNLRMPDDIYKILHNARKARNAVAHDLTVGMEGCLDCKLDESRFLQEVSGYIFDLARGQVLISIMTNEFNGEASLQPSLIQIYKDNIVNWVIEK